MGHLTDTYKNKKTRNDDSNDETFWGHPTKPEKGIETKVSIGDEVGENKFPVSATSSEANKDGEYWDPLTDTYKNKKTRDDDSDNEIFWDHPTKSEKGIETKVSTGYEVGENKFSTSAPRLESNVDGEY